MKKKFDILEKLEKQTNVDLEKEIGKEWVPYDQLGFDLTKHEFSQIAHHFYEFGKNRNNSIVKLAAVSAFLAMLVIYIVMLLVSNYRLKEQVRSQTEALAAYGYLIHDIWWDNPEYFDRNIRTKRSFYDVDRALEGDWEDIFYEW